jgi:hypothetical protein
MKIGTIIITAGILALGLATWTPSKAQGPLYDRVKVNLPYSVTIGERTLPPGDYVIQQLRDSGGGSRVLLIYSDSGMKFETSAMTIPALDNRTPEDTKVVLHHFGNDYYFDKVWIQGKNYGYEFPMPDAVKARERERAQPLTVAADYSTAQPESTSTATTTTTTTTTDSSAAQVATPPTTTATSPAPVTVETPPVDFAQAPATTPRTPEPPAMTQPDTTSGTAERSIPESADRSMPDTAAGWLMMLLGGGALSGAGLALRRKQ